MKALSIRQPWAWLIVNGYKTVENRSRSLGHPFGDILIHASKAMSSDDYIACEIFLRSAPEFKPALDALPPADQLVRGGIVGQARIESKISNMPLDLFKPGTWYTGEIGYVLSNAKRLPFKPCKGRLGFFDVDYEALPS